MVDTDISFQSTHEAALNAGLHIGDSSPPVHKSFDGGGFDLHFVDWGGEGKPAIIFIHGFLQHARTWDFTCLALRTRFRCISLDLRGHGDSGRPSDPDYTTHHYLSDLTLLAENVKKMLSISKFSLCGLSLGGQVSYLYASKRPKDVDSVVIVDVAPELSREARKGVRRYISALPRDGSFKTLVDRVADLSPMRSREQVESSLRRATRIDPDGSWEWKHDPRLLDFHRVSFTADQLWDALGKVGAPSLFVIGSNSKMVAPNTVRRMVETVTGSSACYVPRASHRVPGDNPLGFFRAVEPFFERHLLIEPREAQPR